MPTFLAYTVGMNKHSKSKQYTIRGIPWPIDKQIRKLASQRGSSLNAWVLAILTKAIGLEEPEQTYHDLDALSGQWQEDEEITQALAEQRFIDNELWK